MAEAKNSKKQVTPRKTTATTKKSTPFTKTRSNKNGERARTKQAPTASTSFKRVAESTPFITFAITRQTIYWVIFSVAIVALAVWVLTLNNKVQSLYDQIQTTELQTEELDLKKPSTPPVTSPATPTD